MGKMWHGRRRGGASVARASSALRVVSGKYRGRTLQSPASSLTHPMGAREKLALFNMVNVEGQRVLDAYAGSGALGIEALSRGAAETVFVENSAKIARTIRENLTIVGENGSATAQNFVEKVADFAKRAEFAGYFDVIVADPPYDKIDRAEIDLLPSLLRDDGTLILSTPAEEAELILTGMRVSSSHTYARARLTTYRCEEE